MKSTPRDNNSRSMSWRRRFLTTAIAAVLLAFFSVPIGFMLYGAGAAIGGLIVIVMMILIQFPVFFILKRMGVLTSTDRDSDS